MVNTCLAFIENKTYYFFYGDSHPVQPCASRTSSAISNYLLKIYFNIIPPPMHWFYNFVSLLSSPLYFTSYRMNLGILALIVFG
jgi:hypothetical protein